MDDDVNNLVTVAVFDDPTEAALARNQLESAGIRAVLGEENSANIGWVLTGSQGGVKLLVAQHDAETAQVLLDDKPWQKPSDEDKTAVMSTHTLAQVRAEEQEDEDTPLSRREKQATRAYKTTVFGLIFCFLLPYALYLFIDVCLSSGRLQGMPRRHARLAGLILLALMLIPVLLVAAALLTPPPPKNEDDLRHWPHPEVLVGQWKTDPWNREPDVRMELGPKGEFSYADTGFLNLECTGVWGYTNHTLYIKVENVTKGTSPYLGKIGAWQMEKCTHNEMILLVDGLQKLVMVRQR